MAFKLGKQNRYDGSGNANTPKSPMEFGSSGLGSNNIKVEPTMPNGVLAEANNDGTISVNRNLDIRSPLGKRVIKHEMQHMKDMESGRANYDNKKITWEGQTFDRIIVNGEPGIMWEGTFREDGWEGFPWEQSAIKAENK
tara:strand:- start:342 stop:761 length:420 start_codon:yes stop_codon:yes gene_type:complete